jgi:hypothetical protein
VFAYDWLGRQIAFDLKRAIDREPAISILEPGTGQLLETPEGFLGFLNRELVEYADAALATGFFEAWRTKGGAAPGPKQCIGYKQPLFMGGVDEVTNLELSDLSVYISTCGQFYEQVRKLPPGTRIAGVRREK